MVETKAGTRSRGGGPVLVVPRVVVVIVVVSRYTITDRRLTVSRDPERHAIHSFFSFSRSPRSGMGALTIDVG